MNEKVVVSIRCFTYNHEPYIRQCLEGFVMQKTNFRFEAVVHDDASTDGTAAIIREYAEKYPDIIKPIYETENQYSKHDGSLKRIMDAHMRGKYIAICEGDDYWTDPYKLQKQVSYLESHLNCVLSHTGFMYLKGDKLISSDLDREKIHRVPDNKIYYEILNNNYYRIQTCTALYRMSSYLDSISELDKVSSLFMMGDTPLWINLLRHGKVHYHDDVTSVYRFSENSATRQHTPVLFWKFAMSAAEMRLFYCYKLHLEVNQQSVLEKQYLKCFIVYKAFDPSYTPIVQISIPKHISFLTSSRIIMYLYRLWRIFLFKVRRILNWSII